MAIRYKIRTEKDISDAALVVLGNTSGTNSGDDAVNSNYDGLVTNANHSGEVTGSAALTITDKAVTLAKMADMATASLIYRKTAEAGVPEVNSLATLKTDLGLTGTNSGDVVKASAAEINTGTDDAKFATAAGLKGSVLWNLPEGYMINGKIVPSVASNNLTVALKGMDGNDPSATNPVYVRIGSVVRSITTALSVTKAAGTNWFNAGSTELATKEIDYFVYLGYNATDGVVIGFSRIPHATLYSEFSATTTNEKFAGISTITNAAAGDNYVNVGRFAATLSAGAGYTWSVPAFTATNLIQRPIYETRWSLWVPVLTGGVTDMSTYTSARYKVTGKLVYFEYVCTGCTMSGSAGSAHSSLPFIPLTAYTYQPVVINNGSAFTTGLAVIDAGCFIDWYKTAAAGNWVANETSVQLHLKSFYEI
jgi:hypothetical protein